VQISGRGSRAEASRAGPRGRKGAPEEDSAADGGPVRLPQTEENTRLHR